MDEDLDRQQLIDRLLKAGDYKEAERFANSIEGYWQRAESLAQVARAFVTSGNLDESNRIWEEAVVIARAGEGSQSLQDSLDSSSVLWEIAEDMALAGLVESAYTVAKAIKNEWKRKRALEGLEKIEQGEKGSFYKIHNNEPLWT